MTSNQLRFEALLDRLSRCAIAGHVLQEPHGAYSRLSSAPNRAIFDHFIGNITNGSATGLVPFSGISGRVVNISGEDDAPGIVRLSTGSERGGYAGIASPPSITMRHQAWVFGLKYRVFQGSNVDFSCGFLDAGPYFRIDRARLLCCIGETANDTGLASPGSPAWNFAEIEVTSTGETLFTHNGLVVGRFPTPLGLPSCPIGTRLEKISGSTDFHADLDWISLAQPTSTLPTEPEPQFEPFVFRQNESTSWITTNHPFSAVQRQNPSLIDVSILDLEGVPQRLGYRWGWQSENPRQGTITFTSSPASKFIATLTLKLGANPNY